MSRIVCSIVHTVFTDDTVPTSSVKRTISKLERCKVDNCCHEIHWNNCIFDLWPFIRDDCENQETKEGIIVDSGIVRGASVACEQ